MTEDQKPVIGIIGGTGDLGSGLARIWSQAGYSVLIGSRLHDRARGMAAELGSHVAGEDNIGASRKADIVVIAVPFSSHEVILREIRPFVQGKIVVDAVVPLLPPEVSKVQLPEAGSAAQIAKNILGEQVRIVSAFHNVSAVKLRKSEKAACDILVFSDDASAREQVIALAQLVASRAIDGGGLANSAAAEALTSVLIWINRHYKVQGAGLHITGLGNAGLGGDEGRI